MPHTPLIVSIDQVNSKYCYITDTTNEHAYDTNVDLRHNLNATGKNKQLWKSLHASADALALRKGLINLN